MASNKSIVFEKKDGCFIVVSHKPTKNGYASIRRNHVQTKIHRHIYEQCFGEIPEGYQVHHKCNNTLCINPEHLEALSVADHNSITHAHLRLPYREDAVEMVKGGMCMTEVSRHFGCGYNTIRYWMGKHQ